MTESMKEIAQRMVASVKSFVGRATDPIVENQRAMLTRVDKLAQQQSSFEKRLAALERKQ